MDQFLIFVRLHFVSRQITPGINYLQYDGGHSVRRRHIISTVEDIQYGCVKPSRQMRHNNTMVEGVQCRTTKFSGDSWWLYFSKKNDILQTILVKPVFHPTAVATCQRDLSKELIWLYLGFLIDPWCYKDLTLNPGKLTWVSFHV